MISGRVPRPLFQNDHVVGQDDEQRIAGRRFPPTGSRIANPAEVEEKKGTSAAVPLLYARQSGQTISSPLQSPATDPLAAKQNTRVQGYAKHQFFGSTVALPRYKATRTTLRLRLAHLRSANYELSIALAIDAYGLLQI